MWAVRLQSVRPVGPTGLTDQSDVAGSGRPVGPTMVPCKRPVTARSPPRETTQSRESEMQLELRRAELELQKAEIDAENERAERQAEERRAEREFRLRQMEMEEREKGGKTDKARWN